MRDSKRVPREPRVDITLGVPLSNGGRHEILGYLALPRLMVRERWVRLIEDRLEKGKTLGSRKTTAPYTVATLKRDIRKITREKEAFVYEAGQRENRLMRILVALQRLRQDDAFLRLLKAASLAEGPQLKGEYAV